MRNGRDGVLAVGNNEQWRRRIKGAWEGVAAARWQEPVTQGVLDRPLRRSPKPGEGCLQPRSAHRLGGRTRDRQLGVRGPN